MDFPLSSETMSALQDVAVTKYIGISAVTLCVYEFRESVVLRPTQLTQDAVLNIADEVRALRMFTVNARIIFCRSSLYGWGQIFPIGRRVLTCAKRKPIRLGQILYLLVRFHHLLFYLSLFTAT